MVVLKVFLLSIGSIVALFVLTKIMGQKEMSQLSIFDYVIGITIGSFNYLIVGNKKLDKKEQGYGWIVAFVIGLVVFNVLPLMFAIAVAGR